MFKASKSSLTFLVGGIGLLLLATMFKPFTIINAGQRGVVMYFGKVQEQELGEGIHFVVPIVTSVRRISVRVQKTDVQAQAASSDLQDVSTNLAVNWHIDPDQVDRVYQQIGDLDTVVSSIINPAVSEVLKAATARRPVQAILQQRVELKNEIDAALAERLKPYGIVLDGVSLVDFGFSEEFNAAIEAKQVAEQEAQQAAFRAKQAEQEAQAEINRARGQAEAQRLLRQNLTPEILQQRAIDKWNGEVPVVMTGEGGSLPFINIDPATLRRSAAQSGQSGQ